jgi:hypothetical protein
MRQEPISAVRSFEDLVEPGAQFGALAEPAA